MSRPKKSTAPTAATTPLTAATRDSFINMSLGLGYGWGVNNTLSQGFFQLNPTTRDRTQLELAYRGSWVAQMIVDIPAQDMMRQGIQIESQMDPVEQKRMIRQFNLDQGPLTDAIKWGSLFGGSVAIMIIEGDDPLEPLDFDTIERGSYRGLWVLDRWQCLPDWSTINFEFGPSYGHPVVYNVYGQLYGGGSSPWAGSTTTASADIGAPNAEWYKSNEPTARVHHTRVIRFEGTSLPRYQQPTEQFWGLSVLEPLWDLLMSVSTTSTSLANLVSRASLRVLKIKDYRNIIANDAGRQVLLEQINLMRLQQANEGLSVIDHEDEFENHTYAFQGQESAMLVFLQQIAGATSIPLVRLLGQSPAGLNSTGDSDLETYYTGIHRRQENVLRDPVNVLLQVYYRHLFGKTLNADDFDWAFTPLYELDGGSRAKMARDMISNLVMLLNTGTISQRRFLEEVRASSGLSGVGLTITEEEIAGLSDQATGTPVGAAEPAVNPGQRELEPRPL